MQNRRVTTGCTDPQQRRSGRLLPALLLALALATPAAALLPAAPVTAGPHDIWYSASQQMISEDEAARIAQAQHGGRVLAVDLREPNDRPPFYRVKLLSKGSVRIVHINANRGGGSAATRVKQNRR